MDSDGEEHPSPKSEHPKVQGPRASSLTKRGQPSERAKNVEDRVFKYVRSLDPDALDQATTEPEPLQLKYVPKPWSFWEGCFWIVYWAITLLSPILTIILISGTKVDPFATTKQIDAHTKAYLVWSIAHCILTMIYAGNAFFELSDQFQHVSELTKCKRFCVAAAIALSSIIPRLVVLSLRFKEFSTIMTWLQVPWWVPVATTATEILSTCVMGWIFYKADANPLN